MAPVLLAAAIVAAGGVAVAAVAPAHARKAGPSRLRAVTLEWVGDIALSTEKGLPPGGVGSALAPVRSLLRRADLTLGNLEGTLSVGGGSKCSRLPAGECFAFQAPPGAAFALRGLGFDLVNQANNHSMDYGPSGRSQTVAALNRAGIGYIGFPDEITYARAARQRLAFLGFAPYPYDGNLLDIPAARALIRRARRHAALVVVIIHAGAEGANQTHTPVGEEHYLGEDRGNPRAFAHAAIDAGAALVLGSGPHVIRGVERYHGHLIAYSLGDFVGYHTLDSSGVLGDSAVLRVSLGPRGRVVAANWIPIALPGGLPRPDPTDASAHLVAALSRRDFAPDHYDIRPDGHFRIGAIGRR